MSKKTLLQEATIRRMMKLANIGALSENYFGQFAEEEEEAPVDDLGAEAPVDDLGAEAPVDDLGAEPAEGGAAAEVSEDAVKEIVDAIASAVSEVTGTAVEATGGEEAPVDDLGAEAPPVDDLGAEAPVDDMGAEEEPPARRYEGKKPNPFAKKDEEIKEEEGDDDDTKDADTKTESVTRLSEEEMVSAIAKRVAARLVAANK